MALRQKGSDREELIKLIAVPLIVVILFLFIIGTNHIQDRRDRLEEEAASAAVVTTVDDSYTVYVSRAGKIHKNPNCSGMEYYTKMGYKTARAKGYSLCQNCY